MEIAARSLGENISGAQLAFFGGSFTAINREYMEALLKEGARLAEEYGLKGIRISTRPDAISQEILRLLVEYRVSAVELGAQSMDDEVLRLNHRGHSVLDVQKSSAMIKDAGLELGLQMMTGLYGANKELDRHTAVEIIKLSPRTVRIYPTVVLEDTELCDLYKSGSYKPQSLEAAVELCAELVAEFEAAGIDVIRVGLHASEELTARRAAGPYHPAFMELCRSRTIFLRLAACLPKGESVVMVAPKALSAAIGQRRSNIEKLKELGHIVKIQADPALKAWDMEFINEKGERIHAPEISGDTRL